MIKHLIWEALKVVLMVLGVSAAFALLMFSFRRSQESQQKAYEQSEEGREHRERVKEWLASRGDKSTVD